MVGNQNWKIIFLASIIVFGMIYGLDKYIENTQRLIYSKLESSFVKDMSYIGKNIDTLVKKAQTTEQNKPLFEYIQAFPAQGKNLESQLGLFITPKIKYLYVIHKDKKGKFRFLLDGSLKDKARFNQKLDVTGEVYETIYTSKVPSAITQKGLDELSITYLYPLIRNGEVEALLVFDFASVFEAELKKIVLPLKTMFILIYILIGMFLFITTIQTLFYYQARKRSYIDELTACYNRQYLRYFLDKNDIDAYKILMIDFDYFKKVNDNYGHEVGDSILKFGTKVIKCALGKEDKLFRYGGEEFILLIHESNDASKTAEEIRHNMESSYYKNGEVNVNITVSIGLNPIPSHARNTSEAISIADSMLYKAKVQGRNRIVIYDEKMKVNVEEKHSNAHNIHNVVEALSDDRVLCHFQKIVGENKQQYKYEALVRYIDKEGKIVYPNHFLADIMHTNVYNDLTKRVIDICIDTIDTKKVSISMNLNINDLRNEVLMDYLVAKVESINLYDNTLSIEILEEQKMENIQELQAVIKKLNAIGVRFALDDFGSGYANYNNLIELDIDYIKIDGYLVQNAIKSNKSKEIVRSIINLAHTMNVKTIAEFVSSQEIEDMMKELGSDYIQGFHISYPVPDLD